MFKRLRRSIRFFWQRLTRGWDDSETWSLDVTIAEFILPRLKRYKQLSSEVIETDEEALDKMIRAFELLTTCFDWPYLPGHVEKQQEVEDGLTLFAKNYRGLWW